mgnify:FL=1
MIQNSKEPLGFVHPEISCRGIQKIRTFNAVECRYINDLQQKSTLRGLPHVVYVGGFPKNILGFSKKRKDKL